MEATHFRYRDRQRIERAAEHYLRACYRARTAARASEFASYLGVSAPYLSRLVAAAAATPVREFLRRRQLAYAEQLLRSTPLSVAHIAIASAFGTPATFYRCFAKAFGDTPASYREVMKCETAAKKAATRPNGTRNVTECV
ncbi:MAG TPA: helix-turn-helix domain-containing protein [Thermoanaerobaculia bacterium]|jgi:AraC-like DNA-binding protein|nr:helix-turn-helix domain-containing protein [Thermoanaerobaculia bacterium]